MIDFQVVIPSRGRSDSIHKILELVPSAKVYVDEREYDDYAEAVGDRLVTHTPTENMSQVFNLMLKDFDDDSLIRMDDDLVCVRSLGKKGRAAKITDPNAIAQILDNGVQIATDLGLGTYCWSRIPNPIYYQPQNPFNVLGPAFGTYVIRGPARDRELREEAWPRADVDWSMQALLEERIVLCDRRFYFDHGAVFAGRGGNVGVVSEQAYLDATAWLKDTWGRYVRVDRGVKSLSDPSGSRASKQGVKVLVERKSPLCLK